MSRYGQYQVPEPLHHLLFSHLHRGGALHTASHEIPLGVLEQENFAAQGITVVKLVPGAKPGTDALGNCVYNSATAAVSFLGEDVYADYIKALGLALSPDLFTDTKLGEEAAIVAYHRGTDQTGTPSTEWPPTDCGSSGVYAVQFLKSLGVVSGQQVAHGVQNVVSLLQETPVLVGGPFFNSWEEPTGPLAFVDGNGTASDLDAAMRSGVAGGHERVEFAVEKLVLTATGQVTAQRTVLVDRNSWGESWGDAGCYRVHASTYEWLSRYMDWRSLVA